MPEIHFIQQDGTRCSIEARNGTSLMETAVHNNVRGIDAECGGSCSCATCHVVVEGAFLHLLPAADDMEDELLEMVAARRAPGHRLSCQIAISAELDGLVVRIPETQV
ncbi:MAG: 2Fe-2S iron-sulfur cluster-binding protein [Noviherbaspirillum sp.]